MNPKVGMTGLDHATILIECTEHGLLCLCSPGDVHTLARDHFLHAHGVTEIEETEGP